MSYQHPFNGVVPGLVEDVTLKRTRTETTGGTPVIRVASTTPVDLTPLGKTDDVAWNGTDPDATVISLLKGIVNKVNRIPTVTKITNKDGTAATYLGTYDGTSTITVGTNNILLLVMDQSTYTELMCWKGAASIAPSALGNDYTGAKLYQSVPSTGVGPWRFNLLNDNNEVLFMTQDGSSGNTGAAWSIISKKCLLFNL